MTNEKITVKELLSTTTAKNYMIYTNDYRKCARMDKDAFIKKYRGTDVWHGTVKTYHAEVEGRDIVIEL